MKKTVNNMSAITPFIVKVGRKYNKAPNKNLSQRKVPFRLQWKWKFIF